MPNTSLQRIRSRAALRNDRPRARIRLDAYGPLTERRRTEQANERALAQLAR